MSFSEGAVFSRVECIHCKRNIRRPRLRTISEVAGRPYRICSECGKAQPLSGRFNPGRATNPLAGAIYHNFKMGAASVAFNVLVWGPSTSSVDRGFKKRVDVKQAIEGNGHKAFFSEELTFDRDYMVPINVQERAQLEKMNLIVCLGTDFGAMQEAQEFAQERPHQILLWIGSRGKGTYSDKGIGETLRLAGRRPIFFNDADLDSCIIATASADWVEQWRYRKWAIDNQRAQLDEMDPMRPRKKS